MVAAAVRRGGHARRRRFSPPAGTRRGAPRPVVQPGGAAVAARSGAIGGAGCLPGGGPRGREPTRAAIRCPRGGGAARGARHTVAAARGGVVGAPRGIRPRGRLRRARDLCSSCSSRRPRLAGRRDRRRRRASSRWGGGCCSWSRGSRRSARCTRRSARCRRRSWPEPSPDAGGRAHRPHRWRLVAALLTGVALSLRDRCRGAAALPAGRVRAAASARRGVHRRRIPGRRATRRRQSPSSAPVAGSPPTRRAQRSGRSSSGWRRCRWRECGRRRSGLR